MVAVQDLSASVTDTAPVYTTGSSSGLSTGAQSVSGSAFAAFAGILNQGWNSGVNSNAQSATNLSAQGTVTF